MSRIFINPGHGGSDPGAVSNGLIERDIALKIGSSVASLLRAGGFYVKLFQFDGLNEICADSNAFNADLFISIHCNSSANNSATGTETYTSGGAKSKRLAELIQKELVGSLPLANRGVKTADFFVLKNTEAPAVLVETAFINNPLDAKLLRENQSDFARAIAQGVKNYFSHQTPLPDTLEINNPSGMLSPHFAAAEFTCHCCGQGNVDNRLVALLEELRLKANCPIHINCGYRCPPHNAQVGGVPDSQHMKGTAADIFIPNISFDYAMQLVRTLPFDGTGFYPPLSNGGAWFIHVDTRNGGVGSHIEWFD